MAEAFPVMERFADISDDGLYRYGLARRWEKDLPFATFIMLNPSTADAEVDDPTIRRCINFAASWGMGSIHVLNLYAYRTKSPEVLWQAEKDGIDIVGPENNQRLLSHLVAHAGHYAPCVAAWGAHAKPSRVEWLLSQSGGWDLKCLGRTKAGAPRHPLYLRKDAALERLTLL